MIRSTHGIFGLLRDVHGSSVVKSVVSASVALPSFRLHQRVLGVVAGGEFATEGLP